jgi:hypothetical protein
MRWLQRSGSLLAADKIAEIGQFPADYTKVINRGAIRHMKNWTNILILVTIAPSTSK